MRACIVCGCRSDDASTVILATTTTANHSTAMLHALDGQTGTVLWTFSSALPAKRMHVDLSRDGAHILLVNGAELTVLERASGQRRAPPFDMGMEVRPLPSRHLATPYYVAHARLTHGMLAPAPPHPPQVSADLCPMGVFIAYGLSDARILQWNSTAGAYTPHHTFAPPHTPGAPGAAPAAANPTESWLVTSATTVVNGGGTAAGGCLCAFGWREQGTGALGVTVHSMLSSAQFVAWRSSGAAQKAAELSLEAHLHYLAVAHWGIHATATEPAGSVGGSAHADTPAIDPQVMRERPSAPSALRARVSGQHLTRPVHVLVTIYSLCYMHALHHSRTRPRAAGDAL
jgi:hypothetical protein